MSKSVKLITTEMAMGMTVNTKNRISQKDRRK